MSCTLTKRQWCKFVCTNAPRLIGKVYVSNCCWPSGWVVWIQTICQKSMVSWSLCKQLGTMLQNMYPDGRGGIFWCYGPSLWRNGRIRWYFGKHATEPCFAVNGMWVTEMWCWRHKNFTIHHPNLPECDNVCRFQQLWPCRHLSFRMWDFGNLPACFADTKGVVSYSWNDKYWNQRVSLCSVYLLWRVLVGYVQKHALECAENGNRHVFSGICRPFCREKGGCKSVLKSQILKCDCRYLFFGLTLEELRCLCSKACMNIPRKRSLPCFVADFQSWFLWWTRALVGIEVTNTDIFLSALSLYTYPR